MYPTILLVEDDDMMRELTADALALLEAQVIACSNADLALYELERSVAVNLVLTDIRMPGQLDGLQLAKVVAERWPQLPIIVTSGSYQEGDSLPSQAVFLAKPWTFDVLFQKVQLLLSRTQYLTL
jgi:DNA-binding NtrC family response regulator